MRFHIYWIILASFCNVCSMGYRKPNFMLFKSISFFLRSLPRSCVVVNNLTIPSALQIKQRCIPTRSVRNEKNLCVTLRFLWEPPCYLAVSNKGKIPNEVAASFLLAMTEFFINLCGLCVTCLDLSLPKTHSQISAIPHQLHRPALHRQYPIDI